MCSMPGSAGIQSESNGNPVPNSSWEFAAYFFARMPMGPCHLLIWVHPVRWERSKSVHVFSNLGESLFACEMCETY